jgi:methanogenic corrinoid protein MtbC1
LSRRKDDRVEAGARFVAEALEAIAKLDQAALEALLEESAVALGRPGVLLHVVAPLAEAVGKQWQEGTIGVAHEHFASAILRTFLSGMSRPFADLESAPELLTATPTGQLHELGAMLITAAAATLGWRATYLGASLGPQEIVGAVRQKNARAVGLSLVYPPADPGVVSELKSVSRLLPAGVTLLVGGRAAPSYQSILDEIGATCCGGPLTNFMEQLTLLRDGPPAGNSAVALEKGRQAGLE